MRRKAVLWNWQRFEGLSCDICSERYYILVFAAVQNAVYCGCGIGHHLENDKKLFC